MSAPPLTPEQEALARELLDALRADADQLLAELARLLAATGDADLFGATELGLRDLALRFAARALERRLRQKKTTTAAPGSAATAAASRPPTTAAAPASC